MLAGFVCPYDVDTIFRIDIDIWMPCSMSATIGNLGDVDNSLCSWVEHCVEEMLCVTTPYDVNIAFTVTCHRCHSLIDCATIYKLHCVSDDDRCTLSNGWCVCNQCRAHQENQHHCDAAIFIVHIVRPPENVSSALETLFLSYLTATLCGQLRASARV